MAERGKMYDFSPARDNLPQAIFLPQKMLWALRNGHTFAQKSICLFRDLPSGVAVLFSQAELSAGYRRATVSNFNCPRAAGGGV